MSEATTVHTEEISLEFTEKPERLPTIAEFVAWTGWPTDARAIVVHIAQQPYGAGLVPAELAADWARLTVAHFAGNEKAYAAHLAALDKTIKERHG